MKTIYIHFFCDSSCLIHTHTQRELLVYVLQSECTEISVNESKGKLEKK